jgi:hypothetical protein
VALSPQKQLKLGIRESHFGWQAGLLHGSIAEITLAVKIAVILQVPDPDRQLEIRIDKGLEPEQKQADPFLRGP